MKQVIYMVKLSIIPQTCTHQYYHKFLAVSCTSLYKTKKPGRRKTHKPSHFGGKSELSFGYLLKNKPTSSPQDCTRRQVKVATLDSGPFQAITT